jgi:hypothetical protein
MVNLRVSDSTGLALVQHDELALPRSQHRALAGDMLQRQVVDGLELRGELLGPGLLDEGILGHLEVA